MKDWCKYILTAVGGMAVGAIAMFCFSRCNGPEPIEPVIIHDSITVRDTTYLAGKTKVLHVRDTVYLTKYDTIEGRTDTTQTLIYATKQYTDTFATDTSRIELAVRYSGYNAHIDSVGLQYRFEVQPKVVHDKRGFGQFVGIGVGVGYGLGCKDPLRFEPYVGVHVVYGFGYHW